MPEVGAEPRGRSVDAIYLVLLLAVHLAISPIGPLTAYPPVYHDEYLTLSQSVDFLKGRGMALGFLRTPDALTPVLGRSEPPTVPRQPSFLLALAGAMAAFGTSILSARWLSYAMGTCCVLLTYFLGRREHGREIGFGAACLLALDSNFWLASRQVRPETWTIAMFLFGALLLPKALSIQHSGMAVLSGASLGLGLLGHPIGSAGLSGAVVLSLPYWSKSSRRVRALALAPFFLLCIAYAIWIYRHWAGLLDDMSKFATSRGLSKRPLLAHELERYTSGYDNTYWLSYGENVFIACAILTLGGAAYGFWRRTQLLPFSRIALTGAGITALLARDVNPLYLANLAPWMYLSGLGVLASGWKLLPIPRSGNPLRIVAMSAVAAFAALPYLDTAPPSSPGFDRIERVLEPAIPNGATLLGAETAFLMATRREASYLYSLQYPGHGPSNRVYPITARWTERAHLVQYSIDMSVVRDLARKAPFLLFLDQWDLAWNLYAPFGKYAPVYKDLDVALSQSFEPRSLVLTAERGLTGLWIFKEAPDPEAWRLVPLHDGDTPVRLGPDAALRAGGLGRFNAARQSEGRVIFVTEPGARYWLHIEAASVGGAVVVLTWDNVTLAKQLDASTPIPFDLPVQASGPETELRFISYEPAAPVILSAIRATRLLPRRVTP